PRRRSRAEARLRVRRGRPRDRHAHCRRTPVLARSRLLRERPLPSPRQTSVRPVTSGYVGILTCELHFPDAHSLKQKRHYLRSAKAQLQNRVGAAVAEVDHHELWQRARITVACVAREHRELERLLDDAEHWLRGQEWEVTVAQRFVVDPDD